MEVVGSFFKPNSKCTNCQKSFGFHRRRKCETCSIKHIEKLFCKHCSVKIKKQNSRFRKNRYCNTCYEEISPTKSLIKSFNSTETFISRDLVLYIQFESERLKINIKECNPEEIYKIGCKIGEGGTAIVYHAKHIESGEEYAIKRVMIQNLAQREQIINEMAISEMSLHKNVIKIQEAFEYNFSLWIVSELMVCSLNDLIFDMKDQIDEEIIAYILHEVSSGLLVLHTNQRIHRDIKSDNILISEDGSIKLADFGCAAQLFEEENQRKTVIGTPVWMAPELAFGETYDMKVDIWGLGILALLLADGEVPYAHESPMKILMLIRDNPSPMPSCPSKWSENFLDFIRSCLQKNPQIRPDAHQVGFHQFIHNLPKRNKTKFYELLNKWKNYTEIS